MLYGVVTIVPIVVGLLLGYEKFSLIYLITVGVLATAFFILENELEYKDSVKKHKEHEEIMNIYIESIDHNSKVIQHYMELIADDLKNKK